MVILVGAYYFRFLTIVIRVSGYQGAYWTTQHNLATLLFHDVFHFKISTKESILNSCIPLKSRCVKQSGT